MLDVFAPPARLAVVRAGITAAGFGQPRLNDRFLLLALAEGEPLARPVELGVTAASVRAAIEARAPRRRDRELLATLGIDLDEVRGRACPATRSDDPARWRLRRSPVRPLRVTLSGPAAEIVLDEGGRKVIEVARWASRRGHRTLIEREDLLWGVLADGSSESVRILRHGGADLGRIWTGLRRWHHSGYGTSPRPVRWLLSGGMLVWINGPFGGGKTATAFELRRRLPGSAVCDPEHVGFGMRRMLPATLRANFQDLPAWRFSVTELLRLTVASYAGPVIVPMTLVNHGYFQEIIGGLRGDGFAVHHFTLLAGEATVRGRLARSPTPSRAQRD